MRSIAGVALAGLLMSTTLARAQTPPPTLSSAGTCAADVRMSWDVTSIAGADRVRWRIQSGPAGSNLDTAVLEEEGVASGATGSLDRNLRAYGPVLDGTRYFFRVRAFDGSMALADRSSAAIFEQSVTPDGMFSASSPSPNTIRLDWTLTGSLGACADRIAWEVKKAAFSNPQAPDPAAAQSGTASGASGSRSIDVSATGAGTYHVRLLARHGGDTVDDQVARWGAARQVSVGGQALAVALVVNVEDLVYSACLGGSVGVPAATVRVTGTGFDQTVTADGAGRASFTVPGGVAYTISAQKSTCGTAFETFTPTAASTRTLRLPGCFHTGADLRLSTAATWPAGTTGAPYPMTITVAHNTIGGPARAADLRVERIGAGTSAATQIGRTPLGSVCPNAPARTITITDPSPQLGTWTYRATVVGIGTTTSLVDADASNHTASRSVAFLAPPPLTAEPTTLAITSFRLQNGATSTNVGVPVSLNATTSGQAPRDYKAGECGRPFDAAPFRTWSTNPVPTLPAFSTVGPKIVCLQLRGSSATSTVARDTIGVISPPELNPVVAQSANPLIAGASQTYTVTVRNGGGMPAGGILVRSTLSENLTFSSATVGVPFNVACTRSGTTVNCSIPVLSPGQSVAIRIVGQLPAHATSGHDVSFSARVDPNNAIAESNETNNLASAVATTQAMSRLGEAFLPVRGFIGPDSELLMALDCRDFGASFVMVGLAGHHGLWIDDLQVACAEVRAGGALGTPQLHPDVQGVYFGGVAGTPFTKFCAAGYVVTQFRGTTGEDGYLKSLEASCQRLFTTGLAGDTPRTLGLIGTNSIGGWGLDVCPQGRPARGLRTYEETMGFLEGAVSGIQAVCEQPVVP